MKYAILLLLLTVTASLNASLGIPAPKDIGKGWFSPGIPAPKGPPPCHGDTNGGGCYVSVLVVQK